MYITAGICYKLDLYIVYICKIPHNDQYLTYQNSDNLYLLSNSLIIT